MLYRKRQDWAVLHPDRDLHPNRELCIVTSQKVVPSPDPTCNDKKADPFTKTLPNKQPFPTGSRSRPYCFLQIAAYSQLVIVHTFRLKKHKNEKNTAHQLSVTSIWAPFILHLQPDNFHTFYRRGSRYLGKNKTEQPTRKHTHTHVDTHTHTHTHTHTLKRLIATDGR